MTTTTSWIPFTCIPTLDGRGVAYARAAYGGIWEMETSIRSASSELMGQLNNNSAKHGGPGKPSAAIPFRRPFGQPGVVYPPYTIECHYKEGEWRPDLQSWHPAVGRKLGEGTAGAMFGWWTPEMGGPPPTDASPKTAFTKCVITISYADLEIFSLSEIDVILDKLA